MTGALRPVPCLRTIDPSTRRARLVAARVFAPRSIPRTAILLGHWDGGAVVGSRVILKEVSDA